jgi:signal transduction histidine kinase
MVPTFHSWPTRLARVAASLVEPSDAVIDLSARRQARLLAIALVLVIPPGILSAAFRAAVDDSYVGAFTFQMGCYACLVLAWALSRTRHHVVGTVVALVAGSAMCFGLMGFVPGDGAILASPLVMLVFTGLLWTGPSVVVVAVLNSVGYVVLESQGLLADPSLVYGYSVLQLITAFLVVVGTRQQRALALERQTQMLLADRMVALGTLAAGVAHEVNNPLTYVVGNLDRLRASLEGSGAVNRLELARRVATAQEGVGRVERIIRDLQTFSRDEELSIEAVDLREVVDSAMALAGNQLRESATVDVNYDEQVPMVMGGVARMGQVVLNLLVNAQQAVRGVRGPTITVRVGQTGEGGVFLDVEDNGRGIEPDVRAQIFRPFFTTKEIGVGTGLGLSVCRNIVASMDGVIDVASDPGQGTCFRLLFPAAGPPLERSAPETASGQRPRPLRVDLGPLPAQVQILVVDDEPIVTEIIADVLDDHDVVCVHRGELALDILRERPVHLVLCDLMMPGISGMELHATIVSEQPSYVGRFVFMTGGAYTPESQAYIESADVPVMMKPFTPSSLIAMVDTCLKS